mgnify:CR=1 FL=1
MDQNDVVGCKHCFFTRGLNSAIRKQAQWADFPKLGGPWKHVEAEMRLLLDLEPACTCGQPCDPRWTRPGVKKTGISLKEELENEDRLARRKITAG